MSLILAILVLVDCLTQLIYLGDTVGSSLKKNQRRNRSKLLERFFLFSKGTSMLNQRFELYVMVQNFLSSIQRLKILSGTVLTSILNLDCVYLLTLFTELCKDQWFQGEE